MSKDKLVYCVEWHWLEWCRVDGYRVVCPAAASTAEKLEKKPKSLKLVQPKNLKKRAVKFLTRHNFKAHVMELLIPF